LSDPKQFLNRTDRGPLMAKLAALAASVLLCEMAGLLIRRITMPPVRLALPGAWRIGSAGTLFAGP